MALLSKNRDRDFFKCFGFDLQTIAFAPLNQAMRHWAAMIIVTSSLTISGCVSDSGPRNFKEYANRDIEKMQHSSEPPFPDENLKQFANLYPDRPDYAALIQGPSGSLILPRLKYCPSPKNPVGALGKKETATVKIALIVSEDGHVEDARVYESNSQQFSQYALEAVAQWIFEPGLFEGRHTKYFVTIPFEFAAQ